jgi:methionine-rich copper-binding protein CopC
MRSVLAALALSTLFAASAAAHAFLDHASPAVGSSVAAAPAVVTLWFTQQLEPAFSTAEIVDGDGRRVDQGITIDSKDPTIMHVTVKSLPPGTYRVEWRVVSVDTHTTTGHFTFTVGG